jgi:hypothetical protein
MLFEVFIVQFTMVMGYLFDAIYLRGLIRLTRIMAGPARDPVILAS